MARFQTSLQHQLLTPIISYIVLEDDAQREMLLRKQKQILKNKKYLDASEEMEDKTLTAEPNLLILTLLLLVIAGLYFIILKICKIVRTIRQHDEQ